MKERNYIFDAVKAFAIWLVVLGHCVQYLSGLDFRNDGLYQFIYSFHMPLFFMVSGFFFSTSMKLSSMEFLRKKGISLLLPCFVWGFIVACCRFQSLELLIRDIFLPIQWPFWFFKTLFVVQLIAYASLRVVSILCKNEKLALATAILISLGFTFIPYLGMARMMIPMFWIGYIIKRYYAQFVQYHRIIAIIALILFIGIYCLRCGLTNSDLIIIEIVFKLFKWSLAITGSLAVISAMHELKTKRQFISVVGTSTAGIYIIQTFVLEKGLHLLFEKYTDFCNLSLFVNYLLMFAISIALLAIITWIYKQLCKSKFIALIFFGHEQKK